MKPQFGLEDIQLKTVGTRLVQLLQSLSFDDSKVQITTFYANHVSSEKILNKSEVGYSKV